MFRLKELRQSRNLSMMEVAKRLNIPYTTYVNYEKGNREPNSEFLISVARLFNVTIDYLIGNQNQSDIINKFGLTSVAKKKIPMLGTIACGQPIFANEEHDSYIMIGTEINADFCLTAKGDSMINARINDGDIVFVRQQDTVENGEIAAVVIDDEITLKRVFYYPEQNRLVLAAENTSYAPFVYVGEELNHIFILGKAVAFQSDIR